MLHGIFPNSIKRELDGIIAALGGCIPQETDQLPVDIFSGAKRCSALRRG